MARLSDDDRRLRAVTEAAWQATVLQELRWHGWIAKHQSTSMRLITVRGQRVPVGDAQSKGMLDTFAVHPGTGWTLWLELKRQVGAKVTPEQAAVIDALTVNAVGHRVAVLRPADRSVLRQLATAPWAVSQQELPTR